MPDTIARIADRLASQPTGVRLGIAVVTELSGGRARTDLTATAWIAYGLDLTGLTVGSRVVVLQQPPMAVIVARLA